MPSLPGAYGVGFQINFVWTSKRNVVRPVKLLLTQAAAIEPCPSGTPGRPSEETLCPKLFHWSVPLMASQR